MAPVRVLSTATATAACAALCSLPKEVSAAGTITFTVYRGDSTCTNQVGEEKQPIGCVGFGSQSTKTSCDGTYLWVSKYSDTLYCDNTPNSSLKYPMNTCVESEILADNGKSGLYVKFTDCTDPTSHSAASPFAIATVAVIASAARFVLL